MSRRRHRVREAGPVRKTVEVVVSALFGMAVVGVVLMLLQSGSSPASQGPYPPVSSTETAAGYGGDGGLGIRSADAGSQGPSGSGTVYSAQPAPTPSASAQGASAAGQSGASEPVGTAPAAGSSTQGSTQPGASATGTAAASASASSGSGALGGVVGGLVGGVLGLL
jgi:hypothetical protein